MPMKKKAPKSKTQMIKDHKAAILSLEEQLLATKQEVGPLKDEMTSLKEQVESLQRHPPVVPTDRDEQGNVVEPEPAPPLPPTKPQAGKYPLPPGRPFRVVPAGDQVALTAKALGGGSATMMFTPDLGRRVGQVLCKLSQQVTEQLQAEAQE